MEDAAASARLHGRPLLVRPRHVVRGFFESARERKDSGVRGMWGILMKMKMEMEKVSLEEMNGWRVDDGGSR